MNPSHRVKTEVKATLMLAGPMIVTSLIQVAHGLVDTIMLGHFDVQHLAAGALGASLWLLVMLTGLGLAMGLTPIIAQLKGAGQIDKIGEQFQQAVWFNLLLGLIAFLILRNFGQVLNWIGTDASLIALTKRYLGVIALGVALMQLSLAGRFLSEGIEYAKPMMLIQMLLLPLNILGNYVFIFGHWGAPALGVYGAGISTLIGLTLGFVLMLLNVLFNPRYRRYALFKQFSGPKLASLKQISVIGVPVAIAMMLEQALFTSVTLLMGKLGAIPLAAHQVAINYAAMMFMVPVGLSLAATVRVGNAMGRKDFVSARRCGWVAVCLAMGFMGVSAIVLMLFNHFIASLYTNDVQVIEFASGLLILAAVFQVSDGLQVSTAGALRGMKDTKIPMLLNLLGYWVIGFPMAYILAFPLAYRASGLWWGLIIGLTVTAVCLALRFSRITRRQILAP